MWLDSPGAVAAESDVTFAIVGFPEDVRSVFLGDGGIVANAREGSAVVDMTTSEPSLAIEIHRAAAARGVAAIDAPVSGGDVGARNAALSIMVGADDAAFGRVRPLLEVMGKNVIHAGGPGNGQAAKVCNNMILGISMIALSEAFTLAEALGLGHRKLFEISSKASGSCWAMLNHLPVPGIVETSAANRDYKPGFSAAMMQKDLKLSQAAADQAGVATPLGAEAAALYTLFVNGGNEGLDYSAIVKLIKGH